MFLKHLFQEVKQRDSIGQDLTIATEVYWSWQEGELNRLSPMEKLALLWPIAVSEYSTESASQGIPVNFIGRVSKDIQKAEPLMGEDIFV